MTVNGVDYGALKVQARQALIGEGTANPNDEQLLAKAKSLFGDLQSRAVAALKQAGIENPTADQIKAKMGELQQAGQNPNEIRLGDGPGTHDRREVVTPTLSEADKQNKPILINGIKECVTPAELTELIGQQSQSLQNDPAVAKAVLAQRVALNKKEFDLATQRSEMLSKTEAHQVVHLQSMAENVRQNVLEDAKNIKIEDAKEKVDNESKLQAPLVANYQAYIKPTDDQSKTNTNEYQVQNPVIATLRNIGLTEDQKTEFKNAIGEFATKTVEGLGNGKEFNVNLDKLAKLANLTDPVDEAAVKKQLDLVNELLGNINAGLEKAGELKSSKENVLRQNVETRLNPLLNDINYYKEKKGIDGKTTLYDEAKQEGSKSSLKTTIEQLEKDIVDQQNNAMAVMASIVEIESFEKAITPLQTYLEGVQAQLNKANNTLGDIKTFDEEAQIRADELHEKEVKADEKAKKILQKAEKKHGEGQTNVTAHITKDADQKINDAYDKVIDRNVGKKGDKLKVRQQKHTDALTVAQDTDRKMKAYEKAMEKHNALKGVSKGNSNP